MGGRAEIAVVADLAVCCGILHYGAEETVAEVALRIVAGDDLDAERQGARLEYGEHLREDVLVDEEPVVS